MKKLIALLMALAMVFGMVACGAKAPEAAAPEAAPEAAPAAKEEAGSALPYEGLEMTIGLAPLVSVDADKAFWDEQLVKFTELTGAKVNVEVNDWTELESKYLTMYMGDDPYDVLYGWPALLATYVESGNMVDLTPYYTDEEIAGEYFWEAGRYSDGGVYCVGFAGASAQRSYVFNMDILADCGITEVPDTWDELLATCEIIQTKRPDVYAFLTPLTGNANSVGFNTQLLALQCGHYHDWNEDFTQIILNDEAMVDAFTFLKTMYDEGYLSEDAMGMGEDVTDTMFREGKAAIIVANGAQKFTDVTFDWYASTAMVNSKYNIQKTWNPLDCLGVSKNVENVQAAVDLIKFMNSTDVRDAFNNTIYKSAQIRATDIPMEWPEQTADVFAHPERSHSTPMVAGPGGLLDEWASLQQRVLLGEISIEDGLAEFEANMNAALQ